LRHSFARKTASHNPLLDPLKFDAEDALAKGVRAYFDGIGGTARSWGEPVQ